MTIKKVLVIGGGISGLASAHHLSKAGLEVVLAEASCRLGGWVHTVHHPDGVYYELGPRTLRPAGDSGLNSLRYAEELGLQDRIVSIPSSHPSARNRLICVNNQLHPIPRGFRPMFRSTKPFNRPLLKFALNDIMTKPKLCEDDSVYNFFSRRFGEDMARIGADALVRGITAGDAKEISIKSLVRPVFEAEQKHGGVIKGMLFSPKQSAKVPESELVKKMKSEKWSVWSFDKGLSVLVDAIVSEIKKLNVSVSLGSPCTSIKFKKEGGVAAKLNDQWESFDHVVSSLPAPTLGKLVEDHWELRSFLDKIHLVDVGIVHLEYEGDVLNTNAFGFLVPSCEPNKILGTIFDTCSFPQGNRTILTIMMGGKWFPVLFGSNPSESHLLDVALDEVSRLLGIRCTPVRTRASVLRQCIPQHVVGHLSNVLDVQAYISNRKLPLSLVGSSYKGVSVNDCMYYAQQESQQILDSVL